MREAHLYWTAQPTHVRLFLLYLIAVAVVAAVNSLRLARFLYSVPSHRARISFEEIVEDVGGGDILAESALGKRGLAYESPETWRNKAQSALLKVDRGQAIRTLETARNRFDYLWEMCYGDVQSLRREGSLALLVSLLVVVYGAFPTFHDFCNNSKLIAVNCLVLALDQLLARLAFGLLCCVALHLGANWFDRVLVRRKTRWKYFSGLAKNELCKADSHSDKRE